MDIIKFLVINLTVMNIMAQKRSVLPGKYLSVIFVFVLLGKAIKMKLGFVLCEVCKVNLFIIIYTKMLLVILVSCFVKAKRL